MKPSPHADSFDAALYCLLHKGNEGDIAFYRKFCAGTGDVLELACGAGRVSLPIVRQGQNLVGLDLDRGMLERANERRLKLKPALQAHFHLIQGDMRAFAFAEPFDRILIPFNSLYCLPDDQAIRDCLSCCFRHLKPGGKLAFDCYPMHRDDPPFEPLNGWLMTLEDERGEIYDVYESSVQDRAKRRFAVTYEYKDRFSRSKKYTLHHHYLFEDSFEPLLESVGFQKIERREGFDAKGEQLAFIAQRPQA